nr:TM2 domain-containing protein [Ruminococcus bromii]
MCSPKDKSMALILCVVLGMLGAHCFYAGKAGMGILYLFTGGLFGIGWIVDIIRIATAPYTDSHGLPIK